MNRFSTQNILTGTILSLGLVLTGCLTDNDDDDGGVVVADSLTVKTVTVGAQSNTDYGSALDIDNMTAYLINEAKTRTGDIDLIYGVSTSLGSQPAVYSPDTAKAGVGGSGGFSYLSDFNNPNNTVIKAVIVNFDAIDTKEKLDSLWLTVSPITNGRHNIAVNSTFMAKSNLNKIVLIKVNSITGTTATGFANFKGTAKF
jgi:hypothetical protein